MSNLATVASIAADVPNAIVGGPFGSNLVSRDYVSHGVPVIRGVNLADGRWVSGEFVFVTADKAHQLRANVARPGDLIVTQRGTLGQVGLVPEGPFDKYLVSQSQMKVTVDPQVAHPGFIYYWFTSRGFAAYLRSHDIQTGVPHINLDILRRAAIPLPSLQDQQRIAALLGALDDKIERNQQTNATLEALSRASLTGVSRVSMPIKEVFAINPSRIQPTRAQSEIEYVDIGAVSRGRMLSTTVIPIGLAPSRAQRTTADGDTIISTVRPGRRAYVFIDEPPPNLVVSSGFAVLRPRSISPEVGYLCVTEGDVIETFDREAGGGAYPAIRPDRLAELEITVPDESTTEQVAARVSPMLRLIGAHERESRTLSRIRDTLLPKLMSGELRLKAAEKEVAAAT